MVLSGNAFSDLPRVVPTNLLGDPKSNKEEFSHSMLLSEKQLILRGGRVGSQGGPPHYSNSTGHLIIASPNGSQKSSSSLLCFVALAGLGLILCQAGVELTEISFSFQSAGWD